MDDKNQLRIRKSGTETIDHRIYSVAVEGRFRFAPTGHGGDKPLHISGGPLKGLALSAIFFGWDSEKIQGTLEHNLAQMLPTYVAERVLNAYPGGTYHNCKRSEVDIENLRITKIAPLFATGTFKLSCDLEFYYAHKCSTKK